MFWEALDEASEVLRPPEIPEGQLVISKKSMKLLKAVNNMTGIRWQRAPSRKKAPRSPLKRRRRHTHKHTQRKRKGWLAVKAIPDLRELL